MESKVKYALLLGANVVSKLPSLPKAVRDLRALIRRHRPDVLEGSDPLPGLAASLATARDQLISK